MDFNYGNKVLFSVAGIRDGGYREILGVRLADTKNSLLWQDLFEDLKERELRGVKLIVSDAIKEYKKQLENPLLDQVGRHSRSSNKASSKKGSKKEAKRSSR